MQSHIREIRRDIRIQEERKQDERKQEQNIGIKPLKKEKKRKRKKRDVFIRQD